MVITGAFGEDQITVDEYKNLLLKNVEVQNSLKEGMVFLTSFEKDYIFGNFRTDELAKNVPCRGRSEVKSTILFFEFKGNRFYQLDEKKFWLDDNDIDYLNCKEHFKGDLIETQEITLKEKKTLSLLDFKNLLKDKKPEFFVLKNHIIKIIREPDFNHSIPTYCGPIPPQPYSNKKIDFAKDERTLEMEEYINLKWPEPFRVKKIYLNYLRRWGFKRERLPNIDIKEKYKKIMDVEVNLGSYSYPLTEGCKKEKSFPKKKWKHIINWRPPWPY